MTSPAERYAAFRERQSLERASGNAATALDAFAGSLDFALDDFQRTACAHLAAGQDVLVAAPTGAGKTVVGEFAVHLGLDGGKRAFYTTPIKALSNQKFTELTARHGPGCVGLLTGDVSVNPDAAVVVMTTEVLRNMIYARSDALTNLGYVVMDEVHYLADAARGGVWEEVILLLPDGVRLVSLSATVSNAEEFGQWLAEVRGTTEVVVSEVRPVPLWQHMMVRNQVMDLYTAHVDPTDPGTDPPVNPDLIEAVRRAERVAGERPAARGRGRDRGYGRGRDRGRAHRTGHRAPARHAGVRPPRRDVVVDRLDAAGLLPAIVFIFSRAGCEAAVDQLLASGVRLTTEAERDRIARVLHEVSVRIPGEDLEAVGFSSFAAAATRGVAAHHAGLLPVFKEAVEQLFAAGLIKVVFATETLALGINMPARSVVLEKMDKWDGRSHAAITPGEYTQLTGRAGRRGIDLEGHAIVLYSSGIDPVGVAGLASRRTYPLRSSFRPTYNMAVNLLQGASRERVREVLEQSFAQFQADAGVVHLARQQRKGEDALAGYRQAMACDRGDLSGYLALRRRITDLEAAGQRERSRERRKAAEAALASLRPGDVIEIPRGRRSAFAVVVRAAEAALDGPTVQIVNADKQLRTLSRDEAPHGVRVAGKVRIPKTFSPRDARARRDLASSLRNALAAGTGQRPEGGQAPQSQAEADAAELTAARRALRAHPCHTCPELADHLRWAQRADTLQREQDRLVTRISGRTSSIARDFDKVCEVLLTLGYLRTGDGDASGALRVTDQGRWLRRLYSERDLVLAECLRSGAWDDLEAAELAAAATTIVFTSRGDDQAAPAAVLRGLPPRLATALDVAVRVGEEITDLEGRVGLATTPPVDLGLVRTMWAWARGGSLTDVLTASDLGAGDLVRWCRQVLDVLDQLSVAAPSAQLRSRARAAMDTVRRGVVGQELG